MLNVGLTGGIASGKSTVARMLAEKGAVLIDFDELAHAVEGPEGPVWREIVRHFGEEILHGGPDDRSPKAGRNGLRRSRETGTPQPPRPSGDLEEWQRRLAEIRERRADAIVVSDIPLLIEAGMKEMVDLILLVYITPEEQIQRVMARDGFSREEADREACRADAD